MLLFFIGQGSLESFCCRREWFYLNHIHQIELYILNIPIIHCFLINDLDFSEFFQIRYSV